MHIETVTALPINQDDEILFQMKQNLRCWSPNYLKDNSWTTHKSIKRFLKYLFVIQREKY